MNLSGSQAEIVIAVLEGRLKDLEGRSHAAPGGKCPFAHLMREDRKVPPAKLNLKVLSPTKHFNDYDYAEEFKKLDLKAVKADLAKVLTTSQGTYRTHDGRGGANTGNMRFAPLNSWPDNGNLDKARRLLYPIKQKYGRQLSWGDLMILAGNVALETMGFKTFGFSGGREDVWEPEADVYWGPETVVMASERYAAKDYSKSARESLEEPLAAVQMGLIYVNPEGPDGQPDPLLAAHDIRETFKRMAMNDEETVALIAGGHTFGKAHGAADPGPNVGPAPNDAPVEKQGLGWRNKFGTGKGADAITSGLEGAWTYNPTSWNHEYFEILFGYGKGHQPTMFTTDLALRIDPTYEAISRRFWKDHAAFEVAFAKAWYKLTHRDMGPMTRYLGAEVPEVQLWQDPVPAPTAAQQSITAAEVEGLKTKLLGHSDLTIPALVCTAWASASTFRISDFRGGCNGARIRLAPMVDWPANNEYAHDLRNVLAALGQVQAEFNGNTSSGSQISLADLIVLGGFAAVEAAAEAAGRADVHIAFEAGGRTDASAEQTDAESFAYLQPRSDGFRNFGVPSMHALVDRAQQLTLTVPEMSALVAGLRVLDCTCCTEDGRSPGVLTDSPGAALTNDFFVHLLDMGTTWTPCASSSSGRGIFEGRDATSGAVKWVATEVDLMFGSVPELRAIAEFYAQEDSRDRFVDDFVRAFTKVMNLDRTHHYL